MCDQVAQILGLAPAVIKMPRRPAHAAEIEAQRGPTGLHKGTGEGLDHFVVHRAAKQRMRVANDGQAPALPFGVVA